MNNTGNELQRNFVACSRNVYTSSAIHTEHPSPPNIFHGNPPSGRREQTDMTEVVGAFRDYAYVPINYVYPTSSTVECMAGCSSVGANLIIVFGTS
jgi:hypothetical protein